MISFPVWLLGPMFTKAGGTHICVLITIVKVKHCDNGDSVNNGQNG